VGAFPTTLLAPPEALLNANPEFPLIAQLYGARPPLAFRGTLIGAPGVIGFAGQAMLNVSFGSEFTVTVQENATGVELALSLAVITAV
jgi:hypothetical protein